MFPVTVFGKSMVEEKTDVVVLGAGIVGVSTAYAARERGMSVVLVDRREPGSETSYGNAGIISSGSISPLNNPSLWKALPKYLTNRHAALRWKSGLGNSKRGMGRALSGRSAASRFRPRATALHGLIGASAKLPREWIVKAHAGHRIRETGWLKAWRERCGRGGEAGAGFLVNTASPANCSTVRPSPRSSLISCRRRRAFRIRTDLIAGRIDPGGMRVQEANL